MESASGIPLREVKYSATVTGSRNVKIKKSDLSWNGKVEKLDQNLALS